MLYAKILTSPYAHAKIVSMDTSQAEALVGVRDILKFDDPDIAKDVRPARIRPRLTAFLLFPERAISTSTPWELRWSPTAKKYATGR